MARILVADDNSNIQKMVGLALKDQGIDVVAVGNGEAAVRKFLIFVRIWCLPMCSCPSAMDTKFANT